METVQVRLTKELSRIVDASVARGIYPNKSEVLRDALRKLFAPELKEEVLLEAIKRSRKGEFVSQAAVEKEFGL
jgi:putative addiction module CopG family antidote